jgi:hypothetical protein
LVTTLYSSDYHNHFGLPQFPDIQYGLSNGQPSQTGLPLENDLSSYGLPIVKMCEALQEECQPLVVDLSVVAHLELNAFENLSPFITCVSLVRGLISQMSHLQFHYPLSTFI